MCAGAVAIAGPPNRKARRFTPKEPDIPLKPTYALSSHGPRASAEGTTNGQPTVAARSEGQISAVRGPVIDVEFPPGRVPGLHEALRVANGQRALILEVQQI